MAEKLTISSFTRRRTPISGIVQSNFGMMSEQLKNINTLMSRGAGTRRCQCMPLACTAARLENSAGIPLQNIWMDMRDAHNQNMCITGYPTEKNFALLARIIKASSNPGDLIMDCYAGSGTTLAVASNLKRQWIGVDCSNEAIKTTLRRFKLGTKRV